MKRAFALAAIATLFALPFSHFVLAGGGVEPIARPGKPKVEICHIDGEDVGRYISVAKPAVDAHLDHGDCLADNSLDLGDGFCECQ